MLAPAGKPIDLTGAEFDLLLVFLQRPCRLMSRDYLLQLTQGRDRDSFDRSVDVLMSRLHPKLGEPEGQPLFKMVSNGGYQFAQRVEIRTGETWPRCGSASSCCWCCRSSAWSRWPRWPRSA